MREAKKNAKKKKSSSVTAPPRQQTEGKKVSGGKGGTTEKKVANTAKDKRITAQQSIPYHEMGRDGICRVQDKFYSKTIRFYDINYQLAQNEDKNAIFENWCDFLNYFDSTIHFQLSFINQHSNMAEYEKVIHINPQEDEFDDLRMEFAQMLNNQLAKGNNGLMRTKYITFGIEAESIREARPKLERIESDIMNNFKILGVTAYPLNGTERLQIMYETFNQDSKVPFHFSYDEVLRTGLSTKDYIAPTSFVFKNGKDFQMGGTIGAVSYLQILAPELTDKMLAEFLEMDSNLMVNFHIQSIDQMKAIKLVKSKVTDINRMKIEEQKKAVRAGYDMDIIPSDLNTYGGEAKRLLEDLQSRNERMFLVTALFLNTAETKQELENVVFQTAGIAQKYNCALKRLDYQQEPGLMSCLPLAMNLVPIKRALTTTSTAIFVPFTTQELFMGGESIYYGLNALSNNLIMADRKKLKNPNGLILGTPGAGKSFAAKREITNAFIVTKDDIIVCDPEGEYYPLFRAFHGQVIRISPTSHDYINPMDINLDYADDDDPLSLKSDFILSLCELVVGGKNGLEPVEKTVIDRCVRLVYQDFLSDPVPEKMPILEDLYNLLREQKEQEAQRLATALEIYVNGSLKVFNHRTNVELSNRMVCFDIKDLGKQLKKLGMLIVQDQVWNRVTINRSANKSTRYYIDEFHLLLKEEQTAAYSVEIWKRFRKWGGIPTGITQNVKDLLASREIENIFENSDFILMLNQASGDRQILAKQLNISPHQLSYVTNSGEGEGLVFYGSTIIPGTTSRKRTHKIDKF
ncbi:VirB4-like conjugal transfer ATPase, CD1110 family [Holdemanella biformis]|uniref:VirB4-like conjugal transfer ATPase, CD1110 family n=1 Tax=Holdemanella biformis TaxID=1735 RepID=UPI003F6204FD